VFSVVIKAFFLFRIVAVVAMEVKIDVVFPEASVFVIDATEFAVAVDEIVDM